MPLINFEINLILTLSAIKWNSNVEQISQNPCLNHLIDPGFQGVTFENTADRTTHKGYYLPKVEINNCNVVIGGKNF